MKTKKIICVAGARPNFMKIAPLMYEFKKHQNAEVMLVHTGQHYDETMSRLFFDELQIPKPNINLEVGSGTQEYQISEIMKRFDPIVEKEQPDLVMVVGDVNSTIACASVASKRNIKVAHVEAGLRSFDKTMPEEINRFETDAISDYLFTTEPSGERNLVKEGIDKKKIHFVGNVMIDTLLRFKEKSNQSKILNELNLLPRSYALLTLHRPSNVDEKQNLEGILDALSQIQKKIKIVFPMHPRTKKKIEEFGLNVMSQQLENIIFTEPLGYLDFMKLMMESKLILTDSGGMQEEATILKIPCVTLRNNTERPITVEEGTNVVIGTDKNKIIDASLESLIKDCSKTPMPKFWDGRAAQRIVNIILNGQAK